MKRTFSVIAIALFLSLTACSKEETRKNIFDIQQKIKGSQWRAVIQTPPIAPQPPEFPRDAEIQAKIAENLAYINSKIVEKDGKTTYYFVKKKDKDGKYTYPLTYDKSVADYYRVILGKTADGYCAVQDFHANGNKQMEPFIEQDINYCNSFLESKKPKDYLIDLRYNNKEEKISSFTYWNIKDKKRFSFYYDNNGNKYKEFIYDLSDSIKSTEFYFDTKAEDKKLSKSKINILEFNEEQLIKFTGFFYRKINFKDIRNITQYNFFAEEKKEFVWDQKDYENVAAYLDNDPEYEKRNKEFFEDHEKWIKEIKEEFNFRLSQNLNNQ